MSLECPGVVPRRSWDALGGLWEVPADPLTVPGRSWGAWGLSGASLGFAWEASGASLGGLGLPGLSWGVLGRFWVVLGSGRFLFVGRWIGFLYTEILICLIFADF